MIRNKTTQPFTVEWFFVCLFDKRKKNRGKSSFLNKLKSENASLIHIRVHVLSPAIHASKTHSSHPQLRSKQQKAKKKLSPITD